MARSKINSTSDDIISDSGAVLWSFIKGEQLEFPVILSFLASLQDLSAYTFEGVVVEALNEAEQQEKPTSAKPGGVQTVLNIRKPNVMGAWNGPTSYNYEDFVTYGGKAYHLLAGINYVSSVTPDVDPLWEETTLNRVYIQFPSTLASTWAVQPSASSNVYGYFELRVTEPNNSILRRTWKPVRGMVELGFSPTDLVADV